MALTTRNFIMAVENAEMMNEINYYAASNNINMYKFKIKDDIQVDLHKNNKEVIKLHIFLKDDQHKLLIYRQKGTFELSDDWEIDWEMEGCWVDMITTWVNEINKKFKNRQMESAEYFEKKLRLKSIVES
jgi:hypothetical protein